MPEKIFVMGHKNPDTDSIISAIAEAEFLCQMGLDAVPVAQGVPAPETQFVLDKFGFAAPEIITETAGKVIVLVDTTEPSQLPADIGEARIHAVVDHHNLGGIKTNGVLHVTLRPWGSTCTVIAHQFAEQGYQISQPLAGAMMCAILSDTVMFRSPTTMNHDRRAVERLSRIAGLDYHELGMEMLRVKSDISGDPVADLLTRDSKEFETPSGKKITIGVLELIDGAMAEPKLPEIRSELARQHAAGKNVMFLIVDIMKNGALFLSYTEDDARVEQLFPADWADHAAFVPDILSRKKQVIPVLNRGF
ncbi:MAG: manganese-dependent inorganic pyrophosphatase [Rickettsiales bacterium]|jgi:manganese-dependent inorganic pyrophosphatase|nr:manganese-dependent inorganic pyrophosphatase [Rickettsiales bacterium]